LIGDGRLTYEDLIEKGDENANLAHPIDEWDAIGLSYTSGTTGNPKGVVHHHRGAYLNALSNVVELNIARFSKYLWIVPMFHCNGWCFAWSMASIAGTSYFLRQVRADAIFDLIKKYQIGFIAGAPITMITMLGYPGKFKFEHTVHMMTAGAPPPPPVIKRFQAEIGVNVQCAYGLTETYGPIAIHNDDDAWSQIGLSEEDILNKCTYLNKYAVQEDLAVFNPENVTRVPSDGKTIGEVFTRGA
jgi:fatty-acyl-CoA synthase